MRTADETVSWLIFLQREDFSMTFTDSSSCSILSKASLLSGNVERSTAFRVRKKFSLKLCPVNHLGSQVIETGFVLGNTLKCFFRAHNSESGKRRKLTPGRTRKLRKLATSLPKNQNRQEKSVIIFKLRGPSRV